MRTLRTQELKATAGDPFEYCKLDRKKYAEILTSIIQTYEDGFVLGLNNKWGEGKTTFIRMWRLYLGQPERGFKTLYFNAWEHDFNHDPLSAILSELKSLDIYDKQEFAPLLKKGAKLTKSLIPVFLSAVAEKVVDTKQLKEAFQKLSEEAASIFEEEVNEYADKKKGLEDFKSELTSYISKLEKKPLVFFIDELDRCNPKYAVEFLEVVKHFFSVPGIVFVISIDKEQLSHSIKGYFGSENLNTEEYLRRFIDLEYSIPAPKLEDFIEYMFQKSGMSDFFNLENRRNNYSHDEERRRYYDLSKSLFSNSGITLRQIEKIFNHTALIFRTFNTISHTYPEALFTLVYIKFTKPDFYHKIKAKELTNQELIDNLYEVLKPALTSKVELDLILIEAIIVFLYSNTESNRTIGIWSSEREEAGILIKSRFAKINDSGLLDNKLRSFRRDSSFKGVSIDYIFSRVELLNNLRIS